jgi:hypothetical protein
VQDLATAEAAEYLGRTPFFSGVCAENNGNLECDFNNRFSMHTLTQNLDLLDTIDDAPKGEWRYLQVQGNGFTLNIPETWVNLSGIVFKTTVNNLIEILRLEVPSSSDAQRQLILPDGCVDMAFILGDDIKRYTSGDEFVIQPRAMVLGQTIEPFYIEPTGYVNTFAIRFYPYGFANFVSMPIKDLANKETPIASLFGEKTANKLEQKIIEAKTNGERIEIIEKLIRNSSDENLSKSLTS